MWTTLYASISVLWRGSQGKPIEARLANEPSHKVLAWDRLVSNTKRDGGCAGAGAKPVEGVATPGKVWGNGRGWDWSHMQGLGFS